MCALFHRITIFFHNPFASNLLSFWFLICSFPSLPFPFPFFSLLSLNNWTSRRFYTFPYSFFCLSLAFFCNFPPSSSFFFIFKCLSTFIAVIYLIFEFDEDKKKKFMPLWNGNSKKNENVSLFVCGENEESIWNKQTEEKKATTTKKNRTEEISQPDRFKCTPYLLHFFFFFDVSVFLVSFFHACIFFLVLTSRIRHRNMTLHLLVVDLITIHKRKSRNETKIKERTGGEERKTRKKLTKEKSDDNNDDVDAKGW